MCVRPRLAWREAARHCPHVRVRCLSPGRGAAGAGGPRDTGGGEEKGGFREKKEYKDEQTQLWVGYQKHDFDEFM